jgi:hypothetical protein
MFNLVNPVLADRRLWSFNRLSGDDEAGGERIDFHCKEKIGRRNAGRSLVAFASCDRAQGLADATYGPRLSLIGLIGGNQHGLRLSSKFALQRLQCLCSLSVYCRHLQVMFGRNCIPRVRLSAQRVKRNFAVTASSTMPGGAAYFEAANFAATQS